MDRAKKRKIAAITAAINYFNEEMAQAQPMQPVAEAVAQYIPPLWGMSGRQDQMFMRNIWQRRVAKSW